MLGLAVLASSCLCGGCGLPGKARGLFGSDTTPGPSFPSTETRAELVQVREIPAAGEDQERKIELLVRLPEFGGTGIRAARVIVRSAVDDFGTDLVRRNPPPGRPQARSVAPGGGILVPLNAPSPAAKRLPTVSVEVQLDTTTPDPSSLVTIPEILEEAGTPLESRALAEAGAAVLILTPEQVEAERNATAGKASAAGREKGLQGGLLDASIWIACKRDFSAAEGEVVLKVTDPKSRIREFLFLDPSGNLRAVHREERAGFDVLAGEGGSPGPGWGLQVHLQSPKTLRRYRFTLKDVALR